MNIDIEIDSIRHFNCYEPRPRQDIGAGLASVLLINLSKYRQRKAIAAEVSTVKTERKLAVGCLR